jgi:hypothetical protein
MSRRLRRRSGLLAPLLAVTLATSGCSLVLTEGPPPRQERARNPNFDCSTGYGAPALDTGVVVLGLSFLAIQGAGAYAVGGLSHSQGDLFAFGSMLVFFTSAMAGYGRVHACREAIEEAEPPPELPHHHRPPPTRPTSSSAPNASGPPVPQSGDADDEP